MKSRARKIGGIAALILAAAVLYSLFWPVPIEPVSWQVSPGPGFTGAFASNTRLADLKTIDVGSEHGPEHIAIGPGGKLYAAMTSGNLFRMDPDGANQEVFANTGGRVLGFDFDAQGRMIAADAMKGLLAIAPDFEPFPTDAERSFSFWSLRLQPETGRVLDPKAMRVAELRGCFGATRERPRQNFYAEVKLGSVSFQGKGECLALNVDFPETGLFPVRCQLVLSGLPPPYVGGVLTTNTVTSQAAFGGETNPPGYTQASIATIRLWRQRR